MVKHNAPVQIRLTEPVIYLRGTSTGADFRGRPQPVREGSSAVVRGLLTLRVPKPTRIRNISITLEGNARTEWPEGIGPRRTDTYEEHELINETTTFFSGTEEAKAATARRSASVGPGVLSQYDLDSDEEAAWAEEGEWEDRGRPLPRSLSVLPADPSDWEEWYLGGMSRRGSPVGSGPPSRQVSSADLGGLVTAAPNLAVNARGPTPAYTPTPLPVSPTPTPPPLSSHASQRSSILLHRGGSRSPMPLPNGGGVSRRTSEQESSSSAWEGETPLAEPSEPNFPGTPGTPGSPMPNVRFHEGAADTVRAKRSEKVEAGAGDTRLRRIASHRSEDELEDGDDYHPVRDATFALPTAHNTPLASPALGAANLSSRPPSLHLERQASDNPPEDRPPTTRRHMSLRSDGEHCPSQNPRSARASIDDSHHSSGLASPSVEDRGRQHHSHDKHSTGGHHHKFSLASALRGLSLGGGRSQSRASSRHGSRASSRTRVPEPPYSAHSTGTHPHTLHSPHLPHALLDDGVPMSRNSSLQNLPALRTSARSRNSSPAPSASRDRGESRGRSRHRLFGGEEEDGHVHNWKEFKKGVYNYPISFTIPPNAPPTIHAEFGSVVYRLKATVVRVGALTPNLTEEKEVTMIAGPQEDDMEETENVIVERQWEDQMRYQIALSGKAFPIGGAIPISIRLMPLSKCKVFRITIALEEKTDYFAAGKKVARHETPRRFILFAAKAPSEKKDRGDSLLPILSESTTAAKDSPLAPLARQAALNNPREFADLANPEDDVYASLLDPMGPWHLEKDLVVPDCQSRIKFTSKHESTNMSVQHWLKVTIRVERGDDNAVDSKGRRKQFDIIIETPIKMLDCRVNTQYNSLPSYDRVNIDPSPLGKGCAIHAKEAATKSTTGPSSLIGMGTNVLNTLVHPSQLYHSTSGPTPLTVTANPSERTSPAGSQAHTPGAQTPATCGAGTPGASGVILPPAHSHAHGSHAPGQPEHDDTLLERNIVYDRLISGQEAETGEEPPTYKEAVAHAIRSARSASRAGSRVPSVTPSRSHSRAVSRRSSPTRMYIDE